MTRGPYPGNRCLAFLLAGEGQHGEREADLKVCERGASGRATALPWPRTRA
jgi:hypothetical protein